MAASVTGRSSVDSHHVVEEAVPDATVTSYHSVDSHHAETTVAIMSYNVGIHNDEVTGGKWSKPGGKYEKLRTDIANIFNHSSGIQVLLISEMGSMFNKMKGVREIVE